MSVNDESEVISFAVEDFEVLDECVADEEELENLEDAVSQRSTDDSEAKNSSNNKNDIDFTADISLDDSYADQAVMEHLNEIETIVLDAQSFGLETEEEEAGESVKEQEPEVILLDSDKSDDSKRMADKEVEVLEKEGGEQKKEEEPRVEWYEKKLEAKATLAKERLAKFSRVLESSYPVYSKWIEYQNFINKSKICKLDPPIKCPLDRPHPNRWKFRCVKKPRDQSTVEKAAESEEKNNEKDNSDEIKIIEQTKDDEEVKEIDDNEKVDDKVNNEEFEKKADDDSVWRMVACGDSGGNADGAMLKNPDFVTHAVKIFEDFINKSIEDDTEKDKKNDEGDKSKEKDGNNSSNEYWLSLLVRSNSKDELMLFATGRHISQARTAALKQLYESGEGKDCNVKSLYCKNSSGIYNVACQTIFLNGSESLDETVGDLKIQLAPKTNFWSNTIGALQLAKTVEEFVEPIPKMVILEVGCGVGLMGLMLSKKCLKVIGVDTQSEIEEAEMACELNKIDNAKFISLEMDDALKTIVGACAHNRTTAIINANTTTGRRIEIIRRLRRLTSITKIVMITTLTKYSIRSLLELANISDKKFGLPFIPIRAVVVDTLPTGPHFEVVILMKRRSKVKIMNPKMIRSSNTKAKNVSRAQVRSAGKGKSAPAGKSSNSQGKALVKNPFHENSQGKKHKSRRQPAPRSQQQNQQQLPFKRRNESAMFRISVPTKRARTEANDLRSRLSQNRPQESDLIQQVKEQQKILQLAKQKLSGPNVDPVTARQLQDMLNLALERTSQIEHQLPRSVWDRIAPPEANFREAPGNSRNYPDNYRDIPLRGSLVQERGGQDIVITTPNQQFQAPGNRYSNDILPESQQNSRSAIGFSDFLDNSRNNRNRRDVAPYEHRSDRNTWTGGSGGSRSRERSRSPSRRNIRPLSSFQPERSPPPRRAPSPQRRNIDLLGQRRSTDLSNSRALSPPRRLMSPIRGTMQTSSFGGDWDIPPRNALEQSGFGRQEPSSNWMSQSASDFGRSNDFGRNDNNQFASLVNRWNSSQLMANNGSNRNSRDFGGQKGNDNWNDLPEDARDPWDDPSKDRRSLGNLGNFGNMGNSFRNVGDRGEGQWSSGGSFMNDQRWQNDQSSQSYQNWRPSGGISGGFQGRSFGSYGDRR